MYVLSKQHIYILLTDYSKDTVTQAIVFKIQYYINNTRARHKDAANFGEEICISLQQESKQGV